MAATPPWTEPIGLYIHSAGSTAKTALPKSASTIDTSISWAKGGGDSVPSTVARRNSRPESSMAAAAVAAGSCHWKLRTCN